MDAELSKKLIEYLTATEKVVEKAADFAAGQAPEVVEQFIDGDNRAA